MDQVLSGLQGLRYFLVSRSLFAGKRDNTRGLWGIRLFQHVRSILQVKAPGIMLGCMRNYILLKKSTVKNVPLFITFIVVAQTVIYPR